MKLEELVDKYGTPDPSMVSRLNKKFKDKNGSWQDLWLDYLGHAELTKILIAVDPMWNWRPLEIRDGAPAINVNNGIATMWIELTVLGKTIIGVGSCKADKEDHCKELIGDALRNASMRFGIAVNLWSKADSSSPSAKPGSRPATTRTSTITPTVQISKALLTVVTKAAEKRGDALTVVKHIIKRDIKDLSELTMQEARQLVDELNKEPEEEPF